jgi:hypothetical protein
MGDGNEEEGESEEESDEDAFFSDSSSMGSELTEESKYPVRELSRFLNEAKRKKVNLEAFVLRSWKVCKISTTCYEK